ncbi:MAG: hypothetical protein ACRDU8_03570 [Egibacteraceae bacterium]
MARCPKCVSTDLVTVGLTLAGGSVRFRHCRGCENRWWTDTEADATIALPDVLHTVAS